LVTLKLINGIIVSNYILSEGDKIEINNAPQGVLIMEAIEKDNHKLINRKLLPVIHP